jgi:hypothetical protein
MKTDRSLTLTNEELEKLAIILLALPLDVSRNLPFDIRKFHKELFEAVTGKQLGDELGTGQQFSQRGFAASKDTTPPPSRSFIPQQNQNQNQNQNQTK